MLCRYSVCLYPSHSPCQLPDGHFRTIMLLNGQALFSLSFFYREKFSPLRQDCLAVGDQICMAVVTCLLYKKPVFPFSCWLLLQSFSSSLPKSFTFLQWNPEVPAAIYYLLSPISFAIVTFT